MSASLQVVIQVFARAPVPGAAKRRLMPALGPVGAALLHARMTRETVAGAVRSGADAVEIWHTPQPDAEALLFVESLAAEHGASVHVQCGADLGARMAHAIDDAAGRGRVALLVGCDCPAQARSGLVEGVAALRAGARWVFRPALDGGYVCVGAVAAAASVFDDMPWGTEQVMSETRRRLADTGHSWVELAPLADVDRPEDLVHVPASWLPGH